MKIEYSLPYAGILGTKQQENLEESLRPISTNYRLYDEGAVISSSFNKLLCKAENLDGKTHQLIALRSSLRSDSIRKVCLDAGIPEEWAWLAFFRLLFNFRLTPDPWFEIKWWVWNEMRGRMSAVNQWGSLSSGKSFFSGFFPVTQMAVWDTDFIGFIGGPYKLHTQDKAWREVRKAASMVNPATMAEFGVEWLVKANEILANTKHGTGFAKFIAAQEASSVQGGKSARHIETGRQGVSYFAVDEFIENANLDLDESFGNYRSNYNSFTVLSCNPKPEKITAPGLLSFADPLDRSRASLRKETDFRWRTRKGIVIRFCWDNCPNKILGETRYPYLIDNKRQDVLTIEDDHIRAAQRDAWGWGVEGASSLTDAQRQTAAGVFSEYYFEAQPHARYMAVDPAFGGEDPAVYTILDCAVVNQHGKVSTKFVGKEAGSIQGIDPDFVTTPEFVRDCQRIAQYRRAKGDADTKWLLEINSGEKIGAMAQGAVLAAVLAMDKNVPFENVTFDASQRADCFDWMAKVFGRENILWYYEGSRRLISEEGDEWHRWPFRSREDRKSPNGVRLEKWSDWCSRTITMIWAFGCEMVNNGHLVDGDVVKRGLDELGARQTGQNQSGKTDVVSKADIKKGTFQGRKIPKMQSPAWAETLAICMYFAVRYRNALSLGDRPELSLHEGAAPDADETWLELMDEWENGEYDESVSYV